MVVEVGFVSPRVCRAVLWCAMSLGGAVRAAEDYTPPPVQKQVDTALHSVLLVAGVLGGADPRRGRRSSSTARPFPPRPRARPRRRAPADPLAEAAAEERRGNFSAAASRYEAGGEKLKAAECWEKIKDFARAAECWEAGGDLDRAAQLHVRSGSALRAAGIYMKTKNYIEAAKIFRNKGDHLRAAQALELYGNKLAAAREYTAAGNHAHAARLLEQERMYAEAAEAYQPILGGDAITAADADRFAPTPPCSRSPASGTEPPHLPPRPRSRARAPAGALGPAELLPRSQAVRRPPPPAPSPPPAGGGVGTWNPSLDPRTQPPPSPEELARLDGCRRSDQGDPLQRVFTLRSMIHAGRMEPRYSMRLWVQVMRALAERHGAGVVLGCLTPDSIVIDMENNVRIERAGRSRRRRICRRKSRRASRRTARPTSTRWGSSSTNWSAGRSISSAGSAPASSFQTCRPGSTS